MDKTAGIDYIIHSHTHSVLKRVYEMSNVALYDKDKLRIYEYYRHFTNLCVL